MQQQQAQLFVLSDRGFKVKYRHPVQYQFTQNGGAHHFGTYLGRPEGNERWVTWNTPDACFVRHMNNIRITPNRVFIGSLFYLGPIRVGLTYFAHLDPLEIKDYWESHSRTQFGSHVFIDRYGNIRTVSTSLVRDIYTDQYNYTATHSNSIAAMYPSVRVEPTLPNQRYSFHLTLGLVYRQWIDRRDHQKKIIEQGYNVGDRHYYREGPNTTPQRCGHVYELKANQLNLIVQEVTQSNRPRVAFYVCAGTKLVVMDQYNQGINDTQHNRSLVQQGGVVIVEDCVLKIQSPKYNDEPGFKGNKNYTLVTATQNRLMRGDRDLSQIQNPVYFLGPTESEYQSIAWEVSVKRRDGFRLCYIRPPDGGYIEAIEEWDAGMAEILARRHYERLHQSVVQMEPPIHCMDDNLILPEQTMLQRILGMGQNRGFRCNFREENPGFYELRAPEGNPLPVQFRTYRCIEAPANDADCSQAWVPPLYPPILVDGQIHFYPKFNETVHPNQEGFRVSHKYLVRKVDRYTEYYAIDPVEKLTLLASEWIRMDREVPEGICDGITIRRGIDGWTYAHDPKARMGVYEAKFYRLFKQQHFFTEEWEYFDWLEVGPHNQHLL